MRVPAAPTMREPLTLNSELLPSTDTAVMAPSPSTAISRVKADGALRPRSSSIRLLEEVVARKDRSRSTASTLLSSASFKMSSSSSR